MRVRGCGWAFSWYQTAVSRLGGRSGDAMVEHSATTASQSDAGDIVAKLKTRMVERCLPLWSDQGWDRTTGGFVERLDPDGRADHLAPRRVLVQARQIYCFAKAAQMGWYPQGREI